MEPLTTSRSGVKLCVTVYIMHTCNAQQNSFDDSVSCRHALAFGRDSMSELLNAVDMLALRCVCVLTTGSLCHADMHNVHDS